MSVEMFGIILAGGIWIICGLLTTWFVKKGVIGDE
jgi:hypothetical protein